MKSTSATTISFSWNFPNGSEIGSYIYEVMWERNTSGECPDKHVGSINITGAQSSSGMTVTGLEENSNYIIVLVASSATNVFRGTATGNTLEAGMSID